MQKHCNDCVVNLEYTNISRYMAWGAVYHLYQDTTTTSKREYYIDYMDGTDQVLFVGLYDDIRKAISIANDFWNNLDAMYMLSE